MNRKQWVDSHREQLSELFKKSVLKDALTLLIMEGLPKAAGNIAPNDAVANALQNKEREGFYEFYRQLAALAERPAIPAAPMPAPYSHIGKKKDKTAEA